MNKTEYTMKSTENKNKVGRKKGCVPWNKDKTHPNYNKWIEKVRMIGHNNKGKTRIFTEKHKKNIGKALKERKMTWGDKVSKTRIEKKLSVGNNNPMYGKGHLISGELNGRWHGGLSFGKYGLEFNENLKEKIRERDNRICQICGIDEKENIEKYQHKLAVHHSDYNKKNNEEINLFSLCNVCHSITNSNRKQWSSYFRKKQINYLENKYGEISVLINVKDRPSEIALLLQSLRTQTYKKFSIFILDDRSGTPLNSYHFFNCLIIRMKQEGHKVFIKTTDFPHGVSRARQEIVDWAMSKGDYDYFLRVDDDVILEPDYIERLFKVIEAGYDIASGVTVPMQMPVFKREPKYLNGIVNRVILNDEGDYIMNGDDCGYGYTESVILPAHHFRSCALIKREVHEKVKYYPTRLSMHGFREEQIFSYKALMEGFKIGVDTGAVNYHQMTPSGGERPTTNLTPFNQKIFEEFTKANKDELNQIFTRENVPTELELNKETNLLMK